MDEEKKIERIPEEGYEETIDIIIPDENAIKMAKKLGPDFVSLLGLDPNEVEEGKENE